MKISVMMFASKMKKQRKALGYSQAELAEKLNISRISITNYECARQIVGLDSAILIADFLQFSLDEIVKKSCNMTVSDILNTVNDQRTRDILDVFFHDESRSGINEN